jgi:HNH endonuclease
VKQLSLPHSATYVPYGFCHCGCGEKTGIAQKNNQRAGHVKGQPYRFILGHQLRKRKGFVINPETGCWQSLFSQGSNPYISRRVYGTKLHKAQHIMEYERKYGPVPPGLEIDHKCRNTRCCNPDHLEAVTHRENCRRGSRTILDTVKVAEIKRLWSTGHVTQTELGRTFGVTQSAIWRIINGDNWKDVPPAVSA